MKFCNHNCDQWRDCPSKSDPVLRSKVWLGILGAYGAAALLIVVAIYNNWS